MKNGGSFLRRIEMDTIPKSASIIAHPQCEWFHNVGLDIDSGGSLVRHVEDDTGSKGVTVIANFIFLCTHTVRVESWFCVIRHKAWWLTCVPCKK